MKTIALIVAGGSGTRYGSQQPKQFLELCGLPVLMRTIQAFEQSLANADHEIIVTLPEGQFGHWCELCDAHGFVIPHRVVKGGTGRWHSVKNALDSIADLDTVDVIAVHDGVRPLVSRDLIMRVIETARCSGAAIPVVTLNDSVRQIGHDGGSRALDRSALRAVQTPQAFDARLLCDAYRLPFDLSFTDDASVVEHMGHPITLVDGDPVNLKITRPMDLALAEWLLNNNA